jgi:hypothetical protein
LPTLPTGSRRGRGWASVPLVYSPRAGLASGERHGLQLARGDPGLLRLIPGCGETKRLYRTHSLDTLLNGWGLASPVGVREDLICDVKHGLSPGRAVACRLGFSLGRGEGCWPADFGPRFCLPSLAPASSLGKTEDGDDATPKPFGPRGNRGGGPFPGFLGLPEGRDLRLEEGSPGVGRLTFPRSFPAGQEFALHASETP